MSSVRSKKAFSDIRTGAGRTVLAALAMALGVIGFSAVWNAFVVLDREMAAEFARTRPSSASLYIDAVDDALVERMRRVPGIAGAEARRMIMARAQVGPDHFKTMLLFVVRDFDHLRLDTFEPELGRFPPRRGEILFERLTSRVVPGRQGDRVVIQIPGNPAAPLTVSGTVHAAGLAPAWMEGVGYGFVNQQTAEDLGARRTLDELKLLLSGAPTREAIGQRVEALVETLRAEGHAVTRVEIREPGEHPHASQLAVLLFLLEVFGALALLLSGVLVASMVSSLLAQQVRQIGVMKAVGGSNRQIAFGYFAAVAALASVVAGPAVVLALVAGRQYALFAGRMLNFDLADLSVPWFVLVAEAAIAVLLPLLIAAGPIFRGVRVTVREALTDYGVSRGAPDRMKRWVGRVRGLPSELSYAIRGLVRGRGRIALTVTTLSIGGATFLAAANIGAAMTAMVDAKFDAAPYDMHVTFARAEPCAEVERRLAELPGVERVEAWGGGWGSRLRPNGSLGNAFRVFAPPAGSRLSGRHELVAGRWLGPGERGALVINQMVLSAEPDLEVGMRFTLKVGAKQKSFVLVGVVQERMSPPMAYVRYADYAEGFGTAEFASAAVVSATHHDADSVAALARAIEQKLPLAGMPLAALVPTAQFRKAVEDHLLVIARLLLAMSLLVVAVGGLGLGSAMSIRTIERSRELGVIRALGASQRRVVTIVMVEALAIGSVSWLLAAGLTIPMSAWTSRTFGMIFFEAPLEFTYSVASLGLGLGLALVVAAAASFLPAWKAANTSVARALAYE